MSDGQTELESRDGLGRWLEVQSDGDLVDDVAVQETSLLGSWRRIGIRIDGFMSL